MKTKSSVGLVLVAWLLLVAAAHSQGLPAAKSEEVGLSSERLARIADTQRHDVAQGTIPGAVLLITRHGKIAYFENFGFLDPQTRAPMTTDAIFRIYSMSKPLSGSVGDYFWGGVGGTAFWVDPEEQMTVTFMMQSPRQRLHYRPLLRDMIYAAIMK
jgi:CubicO group peptidase (beta-lactamase class C family)